VCPPFGDEDANPGLSLLAVTLGSLLVVPFFWAHWTTAKRVGAATRQPVSTAANVILSLILLPFAGIVYPIWLQGKLNKVGRQQRSAALTAAPAAPLARV
jgi:hypothetical protein